jgi:nitrogen fixation protein FixH
MFAANFALIYYALSTLHGEEVENSYDASQVYNSRLAAARAQDQLGWTVNVTTRQENGGARVVADFRDREGGLVPGLDVTARFIHPFDRGADREAALVSDGGDYEGFAPSLRAGKWTIQLEAKVAGARKFFSENKLVLSDSSE